MPWPKQPQVSATDNISKRWNSTENDVSKNQSSADTAIRLLNTSILDSADLSSFRALGAEDIQTPWHWRIEIYNQEIWLRPTSPGLWSLDARPKRSQWINRH
ncbi:hypothetical protein TNCV_4348671 [Trichonephila clavipes]|nr:hypothetical protein TNCV_4348671 [Trichonephila clavipes]